MVERKIEKVLEINKDMYKDMKNMVDFYTMVGVWYEGADYKPDVQCIGMNNEDCQELQSLMVKNNYHKGKFRHYNKDTLRSMAAWEWLCYSPLSSPNLEIPHGVLYLYEGWDKGGEHE